MRSIAVVLTILAAAMVVAGCGASSDGGGSSSLSSSGADATPVQPTAAPATTWTAQDVSSVGGLGHLHDITFIDDTHGWAVGENTDDSNHSTGLIILTTSDGGSSWQAQDPGIPGQGMDLMAVTFVDAMHGWAVGGQVPGVGAEGAIILGTTDGGATWTPQDASSIGPEASLSAVCFVDVTHGWAVGSARSDGHYYAVILATSDGGNTWQTQDTGSIGTPASLEDVSFVDAMHGWTAGYKMNSGGHVAGGVILATSDGGVTWQPCDVSSLGEEGGLHGIDAADAEHCWAVGGYGGSKAEGTGGAVLASSDGGDSWLPQDLGATDFTGIPMTVSFPDTAHGWVAGFVRDPTTGAAQILATTDGGSTWTSQDASSAGPEAYVKALFFIDAAHGWAVGTTGSSPYTPFILAATE